MVRSFDSRQPPGRPRALVIEDEPVTREFLAEALAAAGWTVVTASDVASARVAAACKADLVLCDLHLPDGDAFEVAALLRLDAGIHQPRPCAIALSAEVDESVRRRLIKAGFLTVLRKPLPLTVLLESIPPIAGASGDPAAPARGRAETLTPATTDSPRLPALDDAAALAVCGSMSTVESLRALLAQELPALLRPLREILEVSPIDESRDSIEDAAALADALHRLHSACGFCGAAALDAAVDALRREVPQSRWWRRPAADALRCGEELLALLRRG